MDQDLVHKVAASKVPMLKPVIENGNAPPITKVIEGVETTITPTTVEEMAQKSSEVLDQTFDRLQKFISQLEIHGEDTLRLEDLYKNLKIYEPEVKRTSSSSTNIQNIAFVSLNNTNSTNEVVNIAHDATTASTQAIVVNSTTIDNLSDVVLECFFSQVLCDAMTDTGGNFMSPKPDLSFSGFEEFTSEPIVIKPVAENSEAKAIGAKPKPVRNKNGSLIIEDWVSESEEEDVPQAEKKKIKHSFAKIEFVKTKGKTTRKTAKQVEQLRQNTHTPRGQKVVVNAARPKAVVNDIKGNNINVVKASACWVWKQNTNVFDHVSKHNSASITLKKFDYVDAQGRSKCSRHMTWNMSYLTNYEEINGGYVAFGGNPKRGKIIGKGTIKTGNLDFENVYFVRDLKFNLFSVSQMCGKRNSVLFNDTECIVLSPNIKLTDESQVLLKVPRKNNMYSVDLKTIVPKGGLTCLFVKGTSNESELWHRRLGHINFKTMNKLVKENLVRGLPSKLFEIHQTCVACQKGKQHRASCKSKTVSSISQPLHMLHMDLFGQTFVKSLMKKMYCLVVINDYSRFGWVLFLATKDGTSGILKYFITRVENQIDQRVKVIMCDNETDFKNKEMNQFCKRECIKREFSVARTPQQNRVTERKNRTLIEAARIMLADYKLLTTFWAEAVNTSCYVQNRVLVTKLHNKTPYELFLGRKLALGFMRLFGCPVTILNTIDHLGTFDGKADEGFFVKYSINSKAFRVLNNRTRIVKENLHVQFSENIPNIIGSGPNCLFHINALTKSMNYKLVVAGNQSNGNAGTKACDDAGVGPWYRI
ncbi:putative ribonuclease H-like domain-containing protein [Tanacetum coccineum]